MKRLLILSLQIIWLFVPSRADAEVLPLNNAAPFSAVKLSLRPNASKDQNPDSAASEPAFITSGFVDAMFYPPHNEYDPNFGLPLEDLVTARYALTSDLTVFHKSGWFGRLYLFMPMGDSRPQTDYNYAVDPILLEFRPSVGYRFTRNLDLRVTYNQMFDLGGFNSEDEYQPWFGPSLRLGTDRPQINAWNIAWVSGFVEGFVFVPGFEHPATPGASADGLPVVRFGRDEIVNARYAIELNGKIQPKWKYLDRLFFHAAPRFFFGEGGVDDHSSWSAAPLTVAVELGFGVQLTQQVELRGTHTEFRDIGGAPEDLERLYANGISLRWTW